MIDFKKYSLKEINNIKDITCNCNEDSKKLHRNIPDLKGTLSLYCINCNYNCTFYNYELRSIAVKLNDSRDLIR